MRTTLDIDDDVLAAAKDLAKAEGRTMGEVVSDLVRRALTQPGYGNTGYGGMAEAQVSFDAGAFPTLPGRGMGLVTSDLVRQLQDQSDRDEAVSWDHVRDQPRDVGETSTAKPKRQRG